MRIVYLLESTGLWGGVKSVLQAANRLSDRGHDVTVVSRDRAPSWIELRCAFSTVPDFSPPRLPPADIVVGTFWTTVPHAIAAGQGVPVHYCQGFEGDGAGSAAVREQIEQVYRLPQAHLLTISPHLSKLMLARFGRTARELRYAVDLDVMFSDGPRPTDSGPVRIGLVGPFDVDWKDLRTGLQACQLAQRAGVDLEVVRVTNTSPHAEEQSMPLRFQWHVQVPPHRMGELYRSMDVFVGSSRGDEEGFFMPAVEAMACGVPCVLTDIPCHRGYDDRPYALFVPPRNPQAMAEAIGLAARHERVRTRLRERGLEVAQRYDFEDHVDDLEHTFAELCGDQLAPAVLQPTVLDRDDQSQARAGMPIKKRINNAAEVRS